MLDADDIKLSIEIKNSRPVELLDLTDAFLSLSEQYQRFAQRGDYAVNGSETRLFIKEIRSGSIIADLVSMAPQAAFLVGQSKDLVDFAKDIKGVYEFFLGKHGDDPNRTAAELRDCAQILQPVAKDAGSQINLSVTVNGGTMYQVIMDSTQANAIQNRVANHVAMQREVATGVREKQTFYWYQARNDVRSSSGDKGVIEAISPSPVKVIFENERAKLDMISDRLFQLAFIVDVDVQTINGKPATYKVLNVHETFEKPE
ncbi:hypothetical protein [Magnetospirillum sp. SS-4]|uniref:hypothetical protein n=1 Tax=Magnetospirillum sp. SS-4 TaxID=2681465 RepID=UPI001381FEEF|nr:hypothetical protein [Magnetospirillum sp. SS-4]CAA7614876.1 conserved hypothetical protein [Magnetospirillum sp. SS-4]